MSRIVIQKAVIKIIKPAIYARICDECGRQFDRGEVTRILHTSTRKGISHYCRNTKCDPWRDE